MRADASSVSDLCFSRQSQRLTRRASPENFHPVPLQTGQTDTVIENSSFHFAPSACSAQVSRPEALCTSCGGKGSAVENGGNHEWRSGRAVFGATEDFSPINRLEA